MTKALKNRNFNFKARYNHFYENEPIREKTILYEVFHGRLMSCNPYAIFKALLKDERFKDFTHIWVLEDSKFLQDEYKRLKNLIVVKRGSDNYLRYLASAKYLINNATFGEYFIRKQGQFYLNTWHGTPLKCLGKHIKTSFMEHANSQRNFLQTTHIVNPNEFTQNVILKDYDIADIYSGKSLVSGYARNDLNYDEVAKQKLKQRFNIKESERVLLYAPTFRGHFGEANFEYEVITKLLKELAVMPFKILFKGHYETLKYIEKIGSRIYDANDRDIDTNELLSIVDILITDYSSIAFDFMCMDKSIIYYCYDYEEYKKERGVYFDLKDLGLSYCKSIEEVKVLLSDEGFLNKKGKYAHLKEKFFPLDDKNATKRVIDFFFFDEFDESRLYKKEHNKINLLFFEGPFIPNGITSAFKSLVNIIDKEKYSINVLIEPGVIDAFAERKAIFNEIKDKCNVLCKTGALNLSVEEEFLLTHVEFSIKRTNELQEQAFKKAYEREFKRNFGDANFNVLIQYDGYTRLLNLLFAYAKGDFKKIIYLHNNMLGECQKRFPYLEMTFNIYDKYDFLLSVSKDTNELNLKDLSEIYNIQKDKFKPAPNFINADEILAKSKLDLDKKGLKYFKQGFQIFINIARLSIEKDQAKLIRAFCNIHKKYPKTRLLILGDGPLKPDLTRLIKELRLKNSVFLLGYIANPYPYLKKSSCFVMSSLHEGQPLVLHEAMLLNIPIVSVDYEFGATEVLENGKYGLITQNNQQALEDGLEAFLKGEVKQVEFNYQAYNERALKNLERFIDNE
ncbi:MULTISPECIES: glycosyltransferase [unclassified Campylobacter]|uniref:glycosyltransferase n=1 Tax=unclassified Campylobacter TaxID=2593542 RepID=UPI001237A31F|nr:MULTISPECIES: glycosyltransferase [unclassified Campylobacter]KAA6224771.1 glycosyltransferase [Campylobacter sp. LR286c]KAA6233624.1 glycosyltransferase [Campylobacter sp. LR291e]